MKGYQSSYTWAPLQRQPVPVEIITNEPSPQQLAPGASKIFMKHISFLGVIHNICPKGTYIPKQINLRIGLKTPRKNFHYLLEVQSFIFLQIAQGELPLLSLGDRMDKTSWITDVKRLVFTENLSTLFLPVGFCPGPPKNPPH